jgi:hypothetical protein
MCKYHLLVVYKQISIKKLKYRLPQPLGEVFIIIVIIYKHTDLEHILGIFTLQLSTVSLKLYGNPNDRKKLKP